jgi:hypothetical protein
MRELLRSRLGCLSFHSRSERFNFKLNYSEGIAQPELLLLLLQLVSPVEYLQKISRIVADI